MKSHLVSSRSISRSFQSEVCSQNPDRIILGIDPGTNLLGYGLLEVVGRNARMLTMGAIDLRKVSDIYLKLGRIYERISALIDEFKPDELAIEAPFCGKNVQSMLKLGRAQGVIMAAAIARQIPICEYAPTRIKQVITGRGSASKEQVADMMQRRLSLVDDQILPFWDATDALAVAYCHYVETSTVGVKGGWKTTQNTFPIATRKKTSWSEFVQRNGHRVHK